MPCSRAPKLWSLLSELLLDFILDGIFLIQETNNPGIRDKQYRQGNNIFMDPNETEVLRYRHCPC